MFRKDVGDKGKRKKVAESSGDDVNKVARAAKIVERMVNQNTFDDIAQVSGQSCLIDIAHVSG